MVPTIGRIVHYRLKESDVEQIMRRRTSGVKITERAKANPPEWPAGAQAHIGNTVNVGDSYPMMIVRVWGNTEEAAVNGQVFLDGCDVFWATSVSVGENDGQWSWPARS